MPDKAIKTIYINNILTDSNLQNQLNNFITLASKSSISLNKTSYKIIFWLS